MFHRYWKILLPLFLLAVIGIVYLMLPNMWAKAVPSFLNEKVSSYIVVDEADFSRSPPELILKGVHLRNPEAFGAGDAITIGQVNVVFEDYSHSPYNIQSIKVLHVAGKQIIRNDMDNFSVLHKALINRKIDTPRGELAKKVVLKSLIIHDSSVSNEDGSIVTPLAEKRLVPQGSMAGNPVLQTVIIDVLGTIIEQQQDGTVVLRVDGIADKAQETIKSIGDSLKEYLTAP